MVVGSMPVAAAVRVAFIRDSFRAGLTDDADAIADIAGNYGLAGVPSLLPAAGALPMPSIIRLQFSIILTICDICSGLIRPIMFIIPRWSLMVPSDGRVSGEGLVSWANRGIATAMPLRARAARKLVILRVMFILSVVVSD